MNNSCAVSFIKKDINIKILLLFIVLASISGGSIIFSMLKFDGAFRIDNIYAMYAFLSRLLVMFFPVIIWGNEFISGTINLIRISNRNLLSVYMYKFFTYLLAIMILMAVSFLEVSCYGVITDENVGGIGLLKDLTVSYFLYGVFYFGLSCVVTFWLKDTTKSLVAVFLIYFCGGLACDMIGQIGDGVRNIIKFIPFSYAEDAFSFANFTAGQMLNIGIFALILNVMAVFLLKKKGVV